MTQAPRDSLIRARLLSFHAEPQGDDGYTYIEDGGLLIRAGRIAAVGDYAAVAAQAPQAKVSDRRPWLVMPGFIDPHIHFPQAQAIGSHGAQLMDWLNQYIFVEEQKFADAAHAARIASAFFDALIDHGTTTACAFCSVHPASVDAYFAEALRRDMRMIGGKVLMDRNAPEPLRDSPERGVAESEALIARWHGRGRLQYAIAPRFAITSTPEQMAATAALIAARPDLLVQTHLAENRAEIAQALSLYPQARDYTDIYARYGMLGPRSLMGHCIHLSDREAGALAESGAVAVFCPTSNLFLGSGLFDMARLKGAGVRLAVATDVGAGDSYSLLRTLNEGYKALHLQGQSLAPLMGFYMATLGNARALGLEGAIGSLSVGAEADLVALDMRATPAMALRAETVATLAQELFLLQTMGDDRAVAAVWVAGAQVKGAAPPAAPEAAHARRRGSSSPDRG